MGKSLCFEREKGSIDKGIRGHFISLVSKLFWKVEKVLFNRS